MPFLRTEYFKDSRGHTRKVTRSSYQTGAPELVLGGIPVRVWEEIDPSVLDHEEDIVLNSPTFEYVSTELQSKKAVDDYYTSLGRDPSTGEPL